MASISLVVQAFIKADTVENLLRSLSRCSRRESVDLVFFVDVPQGASNATNPAAVEKETAYARKNEQVVAILQDFLASHRSDFANVSLHRNDRNLGCYKTCQVALDAAFTNSEFAIFVEDDVLFSIDALDWFIRTFESGVLDDANNWATTGESIYFNARDKQPSREHVARAKELSVRRGYYNKLTTFPFVPSTCFATTRAKWKLFGEVRGRPVGDVELCKLCAELEKYCVFPILPRVNDVGMLHPDGYSVGIHGVAGVEQINNTYLMAEDVLDAVSPGSAFEMLPEEEKGQLFQESVLLEPFSDSTTPAGSP
jgi:hypothetical protein